MLRLISRLAIITTFSFLCAFIYTNLAIADPGSTGIDILKGTGSTGSFSYQDDQGKKGSAIGYGVDHHKSEGSKSKSYSHGSKGYSGHISGSHSYKKSEGSKSKSYSHEKPGHGKGHHGYKGGQGSSHHKSEGSKSKSYSHGKPGHGKSHHGYKGGYGKSYGHKKGSAYGRHGGHGSHGKSPFKHVMHYKYKLGLTYAQIKTMKELDLDFKKKIIQAKADHQIAHMELDLQVHSGEVDEAKIRAAGAKIVASKTNKIMAMIDAKIQMLNLLTAEQRQKMAKMH